MIRRPAARMLAAGLVLAASAATIAPTTAELSQQLTSTSSLTTAASFAPVNTVAPSITGTIALGETLTAVNGTWGNSNVPITYGYAWQLCTTLPSCSSLGTTASVTLPALGVGDEVRLTVTATNGYGSTPVTVVRAS